MNILIKIVKFLALIFLALLLLMLIIVAVYPLIKMVISAF